MYPISDLSQSARQFTGATPSLGMPSSGYGSPYAFGAETSLAGDLTSGLSTGLPATGAAASTAELTGAGIGATASMAAPAAGEAAASGAGLGPWGMFFAVLGSQALAKGMDAKKTKGQMMVEATKAKWAPYTGTQPQNVPSQGWGSTLAQGGMAGLGMMQNVQTQQQQQQLQDRMMGVMERQQTPATPGWGDMYSVLNRRG